MQTLLAGAAKLGLRLTQAQVEQFELYYRLLMDWNQRINLTSIVGYEDVQARHFLDSLTVILAFKEAIQDAGTGLTIIDVGSGAGLPGIPVKIALYWSEVLLLEATGKKTEFLEETIRQLGMTGIKVVTGRAEEVAHQAGFREGFGVALSRAVAKLPALAELTLPFCRIGGIAVAQKKGDIGEECAAAGYAIRVLGGRVRNIVKVDLNELPDERRLVIIDKVQPTPPRYPRRSGMPEKRPISPPRSPQRRTDEG